MENHHSLNDRHTFKSTLAWVSIILSVVAILVLILNLISSIVFNSFDLPKEMPEGLSTLPENHQMPGLVILAMIIAILFFTGFLISGFGLLKIKKWANEMMSVYLWFFTIIIPLTYFLYWVGQKMELASMKADLIKNPEITQFYNARNLALNIHLIILGIIVIASLILIVRVNLKMKNEK
ncbi:MAG: hypothetical protein IPH57_07795 [Saprospiraceae bacterium]|nr:hypothetical protein [Saprospiraceae bacterium]